MKFQPDIRNYFETLVNARIEEMMDEEKMEPELLADLACLALNQLPARYIRHEVDMAFFLPQSERLEMEMRVNEALDKSLKFLKEKDTEKV